MVPTSASRSGASPRTSTRTTTADGPPSSSRIADTTRFEDVLETACENFRIPLEDGGPPTSTYELFCEERNHVWRGKLLCDSGGVALAPV